MTALPPPLWIPASAGMTEFTQMSPSHSVRGRGAQETDTRTHGMPGAAGFPPLRGGNVRRTKGARPRELAFTVTCGIYANVPEKQLNPKPIVRKPISNRRFYTPVSLNMPITQNSRVCLFEFSISP